MGRGRGNSKKLSATDHEDPGSGEEERVPAQKRRGRPQKPLKGDFDDEEGEKIKEEEDAGEIVKNGVSSKEIRNNISTENGRKRKQSSQVKEKQDSVKEENGLINGSSTDDLKTNGFRHTGSRRKSKPHTAAEVGVECK